MPRKKQESPADAAERKAKRAARSQRSLALKKESIEKPGVKVPTGHSSAYYLDGNYYHDDGRIHHNLQWCESDVEEVLDKLWAFLHEGLDDVDKHRTIMEFCIREDLSKSWFEERLRVFPQFRDYYNRCKQITEWKVIEKAFKEPKTSKFAEFILRSAHNEDGQYTDKRELRTENRNIEVSQEDLTAKTEEELMRILQREQ